MAAVRPQDNDRGLMITARKRNLGMHSPFPESYLDEILECTENPPHPIKESFPKSTEVIWVAEEKAVDLMVSDVVFQNVIAVDFEFHTDDTFDGDDKRF